MSPAGNLVCILGFNIQVSEHGLFSMVSCLLEVSDMSIFALISNDCPLNVLLNYNRYQGHYKYTAEIYEVVGYHPGV